MPNKKQCKHMKYIKRNKGRNKLTSADLKQAAKAIASTDGKLNAVLYYPNKKAKGKSKRAFSILKIKDGTPGGFTGNEYFIL